MKSILYIGIDDTDILGEPPGTGRVARNLASHLEALGLGLSHGVTRHQLLVDPRIPYTSHNSSLCIAVETEAGVQDIMEPCTEFIEKYARDGSDPGLCILPLYSLNEELTDFGMRAITTVLDKQEAALLAQKHGIILRELGGTGQGIIGALAAAALRADGNNGRFVDLRGIRDICGTVIVAELKSLTDITEVLDPGGRPLGQSERIESYGWIRPSLYWGEAVLRVQPVAASNSALWEPLENRKDKPKKKQEAEK